MTHPARSATIAPARQGRVAYPVPGYPSARSMERLPLFEAYPELDLRLPRVPLATLPTPVQPLARLGQAMGIPGLYVKRDDLTSPLYGGNKVRKLEFLLAEARRCGARTVITAGAVGSNHCLATAIHGRRLELRVVLVLVDQPVAQYVRTNLLLDHFHRARLCKTSLAAFPLRLAWHYLRGTDWRRLRPAFYIPFGGSSSLGCLGYVNAAFELKKQVEEGLLPEPDYTFVAAGSLGTASGLVLGLRLAGLKTRVVGVRVTPVALCSPSKWARMVNRTSASLTGRATTVPPVRVTPEELVLLGDFSGQGYARFTEEGMQAVHLMREHEGIRLEGTYTGKALAGTLDYIHKNQLERQTHLFWNTYSSADLSSVAQTIDYRDLPRAFHRYFEQPCQALDSD